MCPQMYQNENQHYLISGQLEKSILSLHLECVPGYSLIMTGWPSFVHNIDFQAQYFEQFDVFTIMQLVCTVFFLPSEP